MQTMFQLQQKVNELLALYASKGEYTVDCVSIEQELQDVLKQLKQEKLNIPVYY
jgi:hypothetical protein